MTEGFLQNHIKSTLQSLRLTFVRHLPLHKGGCVVQPQGLSLRFNIFFNLIITRNRVVAKQSRCEENTIVGNYFFIFYDMPHFVRRDIFAFAKVILRLRHSDILFAINTRRANITRLKAVYHCEAIELAVRRIELKKALAIAKVVNTL